MRKPLPLAEYRPDLPPGDHLTIVTNAVPTSAEGYGPVRAFRPITPVLSAITGGNAFVGSNKTTAFLAGTQTDLYRYTGSAWSSVLSGQNAGRWRFAQFGDNIMAANGGALVTYKLLDGTAALTAGSPPPASLVAVVRDYVVTAGNPNSILTVSWSDFNNSENWSTGQASSQDMLDGGEVMGLAGGEYGIVLQRNSIKRMSTTTAEVADVPLVFQFDEIASNVGCMAKGSVAQAGRLVFFLSERGFMVCDGNDAQPIGQDKVDATFFRTYSRQDIEAGIYAAVDPGRHVVYWSMPGTPGRLWAYHWTLGKWATIETDVRLVFSGFTANVSLDQIDALYGNLDAVPVSLDDPLFAGGNPLLLIATTAGLVGTFGGDPLPATFRWCRMDLLGGNRARIRSALPFTDAPNVTVTIRGRARSGDFGTVEGSGEMRANGTVPLRVNAREVETTMTIGGAWTYASGLALDYEDGGAR